MAEQLIEAGIVCYHCGDDCDGTIQVTGKQFCCSGCMQVFLLLEENNLCSYYSLDENPGIKAKGKYQSERFAYLDDETVVNQLVRNGIEATGHITFSLPQIHCSSCIYLLENLHRIEEGILSSRTDFQRKEIFIVFDQEKTSLRKLVELLAFVGYEPAISLNDVQSNGKASVKNKAALRFNRNKLYRIGVAGFCFANIMMLSFPEYFSAGKIGQAGLKETFTWLNLVLSIPVLLFSASELFKSAWKGFRSGYVNIDAPIVLAILVTFGRSYVEIITGTGAGYLDSGTGIIFFMLIGRWFQNKTQDALSFDRDYLSYFPLGVTVIKQGNEIQIPITKLQKHDRIIIRHGEMIPADARLITGEARVDYSFVSGEQKPLYKNPGDILFAGGKQTGAALELEVNQTVSQSYISSLWNNDIFQNGKNKEQSFIHPWSRYFTLALFIIAFSAVGYWWMVNPANIWPALTAVLIVACPCSLLLSATFTNGNMLRIFGRNKFYLKNAQVIESLARIDTIVFDKTGTITQSQTSQVHYQGRPLTESEQAMIFSVSSQSSHPLSKLIANTLQPGQPHKQPIKEFKEIAGQGISASINNHAIRMGSAGFVRTKEDHDASNESGSQVHIQIGQEIAGRFTISNLYRKGIRNTIRELIKHKYDLHLLSGDSNAEKSNLLFLFGEKTPVYFRQSPQDKLDYIKRLQDSNKKVLMVGDGLNDAGALMQSDVGIAVNDNSAQFTPACDAILAGEHVNELEKYLRFAKMGKKIVRASFILSIAYNIIGLSFAVSASLSPVLAAILMPASSISIILLVTLLSNQLAKRIGLL